MNDKRLANLKPFEKGHPGMGGRPKGSVSLVTTLKKMLQQEVVLKNPLNKKDEKIVVGDGIIRALLVKSLNGDVTAIKEILDRIDGKVVQKNENSNYNHEEALRMLDGGDNTQEDEE